MGVPCLSKVCNSIQQFGDKSRDVTSKRADGKKVQIPNMTLSLTVIRLINFIGDNCETNYNECESNPCLNNGTCIDMNNGYLCSCVPGFSGEHCETDVAVCNSTEEVRCYNGGQCIEGPGFKFYCKCLPGK